MKKLSLFAPLLLLSGCASIHEPDIVRGPDYQAVNVFQSELPPELQRVAVLPLTAARDDRDHNSGVTTLGPLLQRGLSGRQAFEISPVSPRWLRRASGRPSWNVDEPLPPDLLVQVAQAYGVDAILFVQLSHYHPYPPLRIGWQMKLVSAEGRVLWSVDEMFDGSQPQVAASARRFYQSHQWGVQPNGHSRSVLDSPRRFGAYTISASLQTLGAPRQNFAKVHPPSADD